jgi:hypothetical protein
VICVHRRSTTSRSPRKKLKGGRARRSFVVASGAKVVGGQGIEANPWLEEAGIAGPSNQPQSILERRLARQRIRLKRIRRGTPPRRPICRRSCSIAVHSIDLVFPRRHPVSAISRSRIARRPVVRAHWGDPLGQSALRAQRDLLNGIRLMLPVQSSPQKYCCSLPAQISPTSFAVLSHRGAARDRHGRGAGCGGRG